MVHRDPAQIPRFLGSGGIDQIICCRLYYRLLRTPLHLPVTGCSGYRAQSDGLPFLWSCLKFVRASRHCGYSAVQFIPPVFNLIVSAPVVELTTQIDSGIRKGLFLGYVQWGLSTSLASRTNSYRIEAGALNTRLSPPG